MLEFYWTENGNEINHPSYYTPGEVECIDAIKSAVKGLTGQKIERISVGGNFH